MSEVGKPNWKAFIGAIVIAIILPLGFYSYFEHLRRQGGTKVPDLPIMSTDSIPPFSFINQDGDTITRDSIRNSIVVADYFYTTCPGICLRLSGSMEHIQEFIKTHDALTCQYRLLSHTVDPNTDSIARLKTYATQHHADGRMWWFLTGPRDSLYKMGLKFYKLPTQQTSPDDTLGNEPFIHSELMVLLDREGLIRGYYDGTDSAAVKKLEKDLVTLDVNYAIKDGIKEKQISRGKLKQ